jgi:hypothetical protein
MAWVVARANQAKEGKETWAHFQCFWLLARTKVALAMSFGKCK